MYCVSFLANGSPAGSMWVNESMTFAQLATSFCTNFGLKEDNKPTFSFNSKDIQLFFELLGCNSVYIEDFCENLGDRLVARFNVIYQKDEKENILMGKYRFKKMKLVLESFFDDIQIND